MNFNQLYQTTILTHNKQPKNYGKLKEPCCSITGENQMCGDYISIHLVFDEKQENVLKLSFEGEGCAILKASASMMSELIKNKNIEEIHQLAKEFDRILKGEMEYSQKLGEMNIFHGLSRFQSRMRCALLAWETLLKGINEPCQMYP